MSDPAPHQSPRDMAFAPSLSPASFRSITVGDIDFVIGEIAEPEDRPFGLLAMATLPEGERPMYLRSMVVGLQAMALPSLSTFIDQACLLELDDESLAPLPFAGADGTTWHTASAEQRLAINARFDALYGDVLRQLDPSEDETEDHPGEAAPSVDPAVPTFDPVPVDYVGVAAPVSVRLAFPFHHEGKLVRQIGLRPPRYDHVEALTKGRIDRAVMIAEMAGVAVPVINALRWPDAERVVGVAMDMAPEFAKGG